MIYNLKEKTKLQESVMVVGEQTISDVYGLIVLLNKSSSKKKNMIRISPDFIYNLVLLNVQSYAERYNEEIDYDMIKSYTLKKPSNIIEQLIVSTQCYLYQLEGKAANSSLAEALRAILDTELKYIANVTNEGKAAYWGN